MPAQQDSLIVMGHRRPDLDSIASALGYAALLCEQGRQARAARCGPLDEQSTWALQHFGLQEPEVLIDAAPTFGSVARPESPCTPDITLAAVVERIARGARAVPIVGPEGRPVALVDARTCVNALGRAGDRAGRPGSVEAIREGALRAAEPILASQPSGAPLWFRSDERLSDRTAEIARVDPDDFLVVDASGSYVGVASRSLILAPPKPRLVLVDHNELGQSVPGADQAELVEVIDHHRLGNPSTIFPIPFSVDVVGSTSTLVAERWFRLGRAMPAPLAGALLAALLSDTLALRSPTTTQRDHVAAEALRTLAGIGDLAEFGRLVVTAGSGLGQRPAEEIVREDYKEYDMAAGRLIVAQAEVRTLLEINPRSAELSCAIETLRVARSAVLAILLLTDPVRGVSRILASGEPRFVARIPYPRAADGLWDAGAVVSRKTQLVPALLSALA